MEVSTSLSTACLSCAVVGIVVWARHDFRTRHTQRAETLQEVIPRGPARAWPYFVKQACDGITVVHISDLWGKGLVFDCMLRNKIIISRCPSSKRQNSLPYIVNAASQR